MSKRKNDEIGGLPLWLWVLVPVLLVVIGGGGVLLGQWLARQDVNVLPPSVPTATFPVATEMLVPTTVPLPPRTLTPATLDVAILIDTTGSMGDEIAQLQNNFLVISGRVAAEFRDVDVRYGLVAYRDRGDEYVTQVYDFTADVRQFQANLNALTAGGGGDTPEDLAAGLNEAINTLAWRGEDTVKLLFVVSDAAAQLYPGVTYIDSTLQAARQGIKIHTLASSGLDDIGEYMLRQIAQLTMGRFIFLTYAAAAPAGGAPGDVRPDLNVGEPEDVQGVGEYTVEQLDDLVLRLITDELNALNGTTAVVIPAPPLVPVPTITASSNDGGLLPCVPPPPAVADAPSVAVCVTEASVNIFNNEVIFVVARASHHLGMPAYRLEQRDSSGRLLPESEAPLRVMDQQRRGDYEVFTLQGAYAATITLQVGGGGEVRGTQNGMPVFSWGSALSEAFTVTVE